MFNKKGFTLIEVIVSIALVGIIAIAFLPSLTNYFKWIVDTRTNITQAAFDSQLEIEKNTKIVKEVLSGLSFPEEIDPDDYADLGITLKIDRIKIFESQYPLASYQQRKYPNGYQIESKLNGGRKFISWVGDKRLPELAVPEIEVKSLFFLKESAQAAGNFEYSNYPSLKIKAISNMFKNPENSFNRYRHDWYVSKPGFIIPVPDVEFIDEDFDMGRIYPSFPEDYIAIPIVSDLGSSYSYISPTERTIDGELANSIIQQYPGRHIAYTITPFAKSLKMGNSSTILPLFIYGPRFTDNLVVHLDASTINMSDATSIQDNLYLKDWKNTRPSLKAPNSSFNAKQTVVSNMPVLKTTDVYGNITPEIPFQGEGDSASIWGRSLGSRENIVSNMKISGVNLNHNFAVFIILRKINVPNGPIIESPIISGTGSAPWSLSWVTDTLDPRLAFKTKGGNPSGWVNSSVVNKTLNLDQWYLVQAIKTPSSISLGTRSLKSGNDSNLDPEGVPTGTIYNTTTNNIDINWNGVEIAELLIYNSNINSDDISKITTYLTKKYNP